MSSHRQSYSGTPFAGYFFALQTVLVNLWWLALLGFPEIRPYFSSSEAAQSSLMAFWLPDLALAVAGSLLCSVLLFRDSPAAMPMTWWVSGGVSYAALYCLSLSLTTDSAWWGTALMVPAALLNLVAAVDVSVDSIAVFRPAKVAGSTWNVTKTFLQTAVFWAVFLWLLPYAIQHLELKLAIPGFAFRGQVVIAVVLFTGFSLLGLASGFTMGSRGGGTPLPLDSTLHLVVAGPYRYVRNPMVVAGLGQGAAVAVGLGSWGVLAYVLTGGVLWQLLVRPAEERDLSVKFGESYDAYCRRVRCWWPTWP